MPTLNWIGKEAVLNHHQHVPFHLLKDVPDLAVGDPGSGNLIVQGDNLLALKALLPIYGGQVKCIYIDPPYNTGNEGWIYNDNVIRALAAHFAGADFFDAAFHKIVGPILFALLKDTSKHVQRDASTSLRKMGYLDEGWYGPYQGDPVYLGPSTPQTDSIRC